MLTRLGGVLLIVVLGAAVPAGAHAVTAPPGSSPYVYWTNSGGDGILGCNTAIGRARADGTEVSQRFRLTVFPKTLTTNGKYLFITGGRTTEEPRTFLTRRYLDAAGEFGETQSSFAKIASETDPPQELSANDTFVYWSHGSSIGRAAANGPGATPNLITTGASVLDIAVDDRHVYWTDGEALGRANLDGSGVQPRLATLPRFVSQIALS